VLVGSGNPEEGELRPQLLDRFGLSVEVRTPGDLPSRIEVVRRRDAFERAPAAFAAKWAKEEGQVRRRIASGAVPAPEGPRARGGAGAGGAAVHGPGHRRAAGELTLVRAARALASLEATPRWATPTCGGSRPRRCGTG
jgi:magnesium chelatase subunit I